MSPEWRIKVIFVSLICLWLLTPPIALGEVQIQLIKDEGEIAFVTFTYAHKGRSTFSTVKIQCSTPGAQSIRERGILYLSNISYGIKPGFRTTRKLRVSLKNGEAKNIVCQDIGRILIFGNGGGEGVQKPFPPPQ